MDRRRTKRVLVKELASEGDTLPLNLAGATVDDRSTRGSPAGRHSESHGRPSTLSTRNVNDDRHYCNMTGASSKRSDVNGGSVILNRQRYIDMDEMLDGGHARGSVEQREGSTAGPVILEDTTLSLERTTGPGDVQPNQSNDDGTRRRAADASQTTGRPFRKSKLTRQAPVKRRPMGFSRQLSLGSAANRARNTIDTDIDRKTFYYPNDALSSEDSTTTTLGRQVSLPADFGSVAKSERQPLSPFNGQVVKRNQPRADVACAPSGTTTTEQMAEDGYISLDLFSDVHYSAPDDVTEETSTKLEPYDVDVQEATVSVGDVPVASTPLDRPDGSRRRGEDRPGLPDHYPVDNTMSTRL